MPLGLTMHGKWDGISMASPQLHSFKHERPAYSTPQPVENTPANNECRMVELRGAKVASFFVGGDEFICLPQAFDLFLKHLVGGLHTVYTKLKRLSIAPVVCNVEQVRILRGLGAIQPGVNRCKLITRKDFEILYQDCTQASRPGRPPKRYPMLPPTTDLMSHHASIRSMNAHGMLTASDLNNLHKRMRLDQDAEKQLHHHQERRMSDSPTKDTSPIPGKDLAIQQASDMHANAANLYLQAQQALRQQYQQVAASGLHNGLDAQHVAAAAGINPALAPLMMMSHSGLFPGGLPPSSMNMLNHINQFAQTHGNMHQQAAAAQAAAQVAAAAQSAAQASLAAAASAHHSSTRDESRTRNSSAQEEKDSDCEEVHTPRSMSSVNHVHLSGLTNGIGSDGCASPNSSISSTLEGDHVSDGSLSLHSDSADSNKDITDLNENSLPGSSGSVNRDADEPMQRRPSHQEHDGAIGEDAATTNDDITNNMADGAFISGGGGPANISSMQTLLTNIQGLLKVAADNARLQEKHCTFEIADLKTRMNKERQIRGNVEKKLQESERIRALIQKRLKKERKVRKILQEQLLAMQRQLGQENDITLGKIATAPTTPITGALSAGRESTAQRSPTVTGVGPTVTQSQYSPQPASPGYTAECSATSIADIASTAVMAFSKMAASASSPVTSSSATSPMTGAPASFLHSRMIATGSNSNNSSNNSSLSPTRGSQTNVISPTAFPNGRRASMAGEQEITLDFAVATREHVDHAQLPDTRLYFNAGRFQTTASQ